VNTIDDPVVEARNLTRAFGSGAARVEALRGVDLRVARGEFVAIMGPSGSGKSTLLHLLGGLDEPTGGLVTIDGQELGKLCDDAMADIRRRLVGFVFQSFNLLPVLTAEENVALPLVLAGTGERQAHDRARLVLSSVGLADRNDHYPGDLAGGEQQRVALARALIAAPAVLLADEPTGNLDRRTGAQIIALLRSLADEQRQTVVMVTHDAAHASMADRVITMRDGRFEDEQQMPRGRSAGEVLRDLEPSS
jgi:putative ABC transport system ATP-binding protein